MPLLRHREGCLDPLGSICKPRDHICVTEGCDRIVVHRRTADSSANWESMTTFDKREEGFEKKFAHDEELRFKAEARRNKTLGLWVAEQLGLSGAAAADYARTVVAADF